MKIFINGWRPTSDASLHMIFRELLEEAIVHSNTVRYTYTAFNLLHCKRLNAVYVYRCVYEDISHLMVHPST